MELSAIAGFISLCNAVLQMGKSLRNDQLSVFEERILEYACHHGVVELVKHEDFLTVFADGKLFAKPSDRAECVRYLTAFRQLCERGYLFSEGDTRFTLSEQALDLGRAAARAAGSFSEEKVRRPYAIYLSDLERQVLIDLRGRTEHPFLNVVEGSLLVGNREHVFAGESNPGSVIQSLIDGLEQKMLIFATDGDRDQFGITARGLKVAEYVTTQ